MWLEVVMYGLGDTMVDVSFPVAEIRGEKVSGSGIARRIGMTGMELVSADVPPGQFAWLGFQIPGCSRNLKVLGEIVGVRRDGSQDSVTIRFKHVFPHDREVLTGLMLARAVA